MLVPGSANPLLLRTVAAPAAEGISRSVRFNAPDSAYLSRTPASAGNRKTWTWAGWVKRSGLGTDQLICGTADSSFANGTYFLLASDNTLRVEEYGASSITWRLQTTQVFRDASAWFHVIVSCDTTQATAANRVRIYMNGAEITALSTATYPTQNIDTLLNTTAAHGIGRAGTYNAAYLNGYLADIHFIDGQALDPTSFGEFSATTGVWMPKAYSGSYGTNGFHLDFSDNSTAAALGTDSSGAGNTWTVNNLSVTAGAGNDSLVDVPTNGSEVDTGLGGEVRGNYCTLNPLINISGHTFSNGNLQVVTSSSNYGTFASTVAAPPSGKWYAEALISATSGYPLVGIAGTGCTFGTTSYLGGQATMYAYYGVNGNKYNNGTSSSYGATYGAGDIIGIAYDADAGTITFYKNGVSQGQAYSSITSGSYYFAGNEFNSASGTQIWNFGQRSWAYQAPSGFKALCTANLPAPLVTKPSDLFDVKLYTGNGSTQTISGLGFSPDLVWAKNRSSSSGYWHTLVDSVRGAGKNLASNSTNAEDGPNYLISALNSDGFSVNVNPNVGVNENGGSHVAWCWDAGSSTVTNTQGSISSQVRANASAGFSVVTYTGSSSNFTVGHGLGVEPRLILIKNRSASANWFALTKATGSWLYGFLNATDALNSAAQSANSSTIDLVNAAYNWFNANGDNFVAYCFAPVAGYSSFGSYTGNGQSGDSAPFVWTGFRPRWILVKPNASSTSWLLHDTARNPYNASVLELQPNDSLAEYSTVGVGAGERYDILSNGFKLRSSNNGANQNGVQYIYACFAESPFQYARAR
jgi:hypothetical protein